MPLRRSPLFCARNSRLRGGEDPGRGRRELRLREGASVAGQRMAAIWRWLVAGFVRKTGTLGRMAANCVERGDGRCWEARGRRIVKRRRGRAVGTPGWRIVAGRCRGAGGALPCRGGKIGPRARGGFSRCRRNGVKRADFRLRVWKYGRKGYLCPRKRFPRGAAAGIKRECSASLQQFPLL